MKKLNVIWQSKISETQQTKAGTSKTQHPRTVDASERGQDQISPQKPIVQVSRTEKGDIVIGTMRLKEIATQQRRHNYRENHFAYTNRQDTSTEFGAGDGGLRPGNNTKTEDYYVLERFASRKFHHRI